MHMQAERAWIVHSILCHLVRTIPGSFLSFGWSPGPGNVYCWISNSKLHWTLVFSFVTLGASNLVLAGYRTKSTRSGAEQLTWQTRCISCKSIGSRWCQIFDAEFCVAQPVTQMRIEVVVVFVLHPARRFEVDLRHRCTTPPPGQCHVHITSQFTEEGSLPKKIVRYKT